MRIDPKIEQPTRSMLGHAMRHQLDDLADAIRAAGNETFTASIPLCVFASGYIAINISEISPQLFGPIRKSSSASLREDDAELSLDS